jgi:hypothetical protein
MAETTEKRVTAWAGWAFFAGLLMLMQGLFQTTQGLVAIFNDKVLVSGQSNIWLFDITTWGWTHLLLGIVLIVTSFDLMRGGVWGISIGVITTLLSALANFAFLPVYPIWSTVILVVDVLVLYALVAHGSELRSEPL